MVESPTSVKSAFRRLSAPCDAQIALDGDDTLSYEALLAPLPHGALLASVPRSEEAQLCALANYAVKTFLRNVLREAGHLHEATWVDKLPAIESRDIAAVINFFLPESEARVSSGPYTQLSYLYENLLDALEQLAAGNDSQAVSHLLSAFNQGEGNFDVPSLLLANNGLRKPRPAHT